MHHDVAIIQRDPLVILSSLYGERILAYRLLHFLIYRIRYGIHLCVCVALAYHEIVADTLVQPCHVNSDDIVPFNILYALDYRVK